MNVLLVAQNYFPFIGGVEVHARQIGRELTGPHRVIVVAANFAPCRLPRRLAVLHDSLLTPRAQGFWDGAVRVEALTPGPLDRVRLLPIAVRAIPRLQRYAFHGLNRFGYPWYRAVFGRRLTELARQADVVHSLAGGYLGWAAEEAARRCHVPFVCTPFVHPRHWGDGPEDVAYYRRAHAVVALVETDREYLCSIGVPRERLHVIGVSPDVPNAADAAAFRARHGLGDAPVVLFVGRVTEQKGVPAVLGAAPIVAGQLPAARFVFVGPAGPRERRWFEGAHSSVMFIGQVSRIEKAEAIAACDVLCVPSSSEILPTVYLEAWSYGKPVVGGPAPGLRELVEGNGAGKVCDSDPQDVAATLLSLLTDGEGRTQMGERGRALVEARYSVPAVTGALVALYERVICAQRQRVPA